MKKLLVIYGSYGSGHKSIAESIAKYFIDNSAGYIIKIIDINTYANLSGRIGAKLFDFVVIKHRNEIAFDLGYEIVDNKIGALSQIPYVKKAFDNPRFRKEIKDFDPDVTITTHYFGATIMAYYNKIHISRSKIITVLTDYAYHKFWSTYNKYIDAFVVANDVVKNQMVNSGISAKKIYPAGLPFNQSKFYNLVPKEEIINKYKIDKSLKTYVFFGGGSAGSMSYYKYFKSLVKQEYPINLIFISGKNKKLEKKAKNFAKNYDNVTVLGFVKDVYSILNITNFVISKPGGATVTECLIMKKPLICIPGIGGQEKYNARFVTRKKYGLKTRGRMGLNNTVYKTLKNNKLENIFKKNLEFVKENKALEKIFEIVQKKMR